MRVLLVGAMVGASLVPGMAAAQDVTVGVKGGLVSSSVTSEGLGLEANAGASGAAGGFIEFGSARTVSFRPEVLVTWRRFALFDLEGTDLDTGATSIEVPLLLCARTAGTARAKAVFFAGPQVSFLTSVWQEVGGVRIDIDEGIKDVDAAVTFGGGVEVAAGRGAFVLDARVIIGLKNLWEAADATVKSRAFAALVGYRF